MVEEWHPSARPLRAGIALLPDGVVERFGGVLRVELAPIAEPAVDIFGDLGGGDVQHRPECGNDVAPAGVLQGGGQGDRLVKEVDTADGGLAGRQEDELALVVVGGQVDDGQHAVIEQQTTPGRGVWVLVAVAAEMRPGVAGQFMVDGVAGGCGAFPESMSRGKESDEQIAFAVDAGQLWLAWRVA